MSYSTVKSFKDSESFLTSGCPVIDKMLRGGFSKRGINQIYGEAGTGKTQLALQLCLTAQIPSVINCRSGVVYICTEACFPSRRLQELLETSPIAKKYHLNGDKIFIEHVSTVSNLESCIVTQIPRLLANQQINIIIIDSIAAPYRAEYEPTTLKARAKSLRKIGHYLHKYSNEFDICVICINQVSAAIGHSKVEEICSDIQPALGLTWACQVTNSFCLCRAATTRHIHVRGSSYLPRESLSFKIIQSGVYGLNEST